MIKATVGGKYQTHPNVVTDAQTGKLGIFNDPQRQDLAEPISLPVRMLLI